MKEKTVVRSVRLPESILNKADDLAKRNSTNFNNMVLRLLKKWMRLK